MHLTFLGKKNTEKNLTFFNITALEQREGKKNTKTWKIFFKRIFLQDYQWQLFLVFSS